MVRISLPFFVTEEEKQAAYEHVNKDVLRAIRQAAENIREYHARQLEQTWMMTKDDGTILGQKKLHRLTRSGCMFREERPCTHLPFS